jgi:hypothetical protein
MFPANEVVLAIFRTYFDESGIHEGAPFCVVAGYIGTTKQWSAFETMWEPDAKAPGFHGREFFIRDADGCRVGPYQGWSDAQADDYLNRLLSAVHKAGVVPIGGMVDAAAFRAYSEARRRFLTGGKLVHVGESGKQRWNPLGKPSAPYFLALMSVLAQSVSATPSEFKVDFTLDRQQQFEGWAKDLCKCIQEKWEPDESTRFGTVAFASRDDASPLQAADMLAHAWYEYGARQGNISSEMHRILGSQRRDTLEFFTPAAMDKLIGTAPPQDGKTYTFPARESFRR